MSPSYGYMDFYELLRTFQNELAEMRDEVKPHMTSESRYALETLNGVLYLVEGQLIHDADGAN